MKNIYKLISIVLVLTIAFGTVPSYADGEISTEETTNVIYREGFELPLEEDDYEPGVVLVGLYPEATETISTFSLSSSTVFEGLDIDEVEIIDEFESEIQDDSFTLNSSDTNALPECPPEYKYLEDVEQIVKIELTEKTKEAVIEAIEILQNNPNVAYAEPNYIMNLCETTSTLIPNDERYGHQFNMRNIEAPAAWSKFTGSKNVVVAIIDTGIDITHPDLEANIWVNPGEIAGDGIDNDGNGYKDDMHGWNFSGKNNDVMGSNDHGTHVAGIIGAEGNNGEGVVGVNWNVSLAVLRCSKDNGNWDSGSVIEAIRYARIMNFPIINASFGGAFENKSEFLEILRYNGLFVAAAGNDNTDNDENPQYPASYPLNNIISVGGINDEDNTNVYNYGKNSVHLGAPGYIIYSTIRDGDYINLSGTSMAAPHVAGAAALLMGYRLDLTPMETRAIILDSVTTEECLTDRYITGGRLNVNNMINWNGNISDLYPSLGDYFSIDICGVSTKFKVLSKGDNPTIQVTSIEPEAIGSFVIPETITYRNVNYTVVQIGNNSFYECENLTGVTIPNSVTSIGNYAFYKCTGLTSITIPNSVTSIGNYAFDGCTGLTSITIPNSVTSIGNYAFNGCTGLTSITMQNGVMSIGDYTFKDCTSLTNVTVPDSVEHIGCFAFSGTPWLNNYNDDFVIVGNGILIHYKGSDDDVVIPDGVTEISSAFYECSELTEITIPSSVTIIGKCAFSGCNKLTEITIPNSVTSIGNNAFQRCTGLTEITMPKSVISIGDRAFYDCTGLTNITIPDNINSIGANSFENCYKLTKIIVLIETPLSIVQGTFFGVYRPNCYLYVPKGKGQNYASADVWKEFGHIVELDSIMLSCPDLEYDSLLSEFVLNSIDLSAEGMYPQNINLIIGKYNSSDILQEEFTETITINASGVQTFEIDEELFDNFSVNEYIKVSIYDDNSILISQQIVKPTLFESGM